MSDLKSMSFFFVFLIFSIIRIIIDLVKLTKMKKQVNNFGKEIVALDRNQKIKISLISVYIAFAVLILVLGLITKNQMIFLAFFVFIPMILDFILIRKYTHYNGIYENGIVFDVFMDWSSIFSWKKIDDKNISILKQDGIRFDFYTAENQKAVIDYFISKGVSEEK